MNDQQLLRYSRHLLLNEIDLAGQETLLTSNALIIGCGGLGAAAIPYLAAAGVGRLMIADDDTIDETNLQRQITYREADIGHSKALAMQGYLKALNHDCQVSAYPTRLDEVTIRQLAQEADIILDCSDNAPTRQAINRAAVAQKKPLVSGAAVRFEGQLALYRLDQAHTPCYACLFSDSEVSDGACATFGVFSPLVGIIGSHQAALALQVLAGLEPPHSSLHCYHALNNQWQRFAIPKNPHCPVCSSS